VAAARHLALGPEGRPATLALIVVVVLAVVGFFAFTYATQRSLLYFPEAGPLPPADTVLSGVEELSLRTEDGLSLGAWFIRPSGPASGFTLLVCNGNAGDRSHRAGLARRLTAAGHAVLLFDYRGYGGNPGTPTEHGLALDARAALAYLRSRGDVDRARVVYFGESLGAAVAARLASDAPPFALVLRSPFPSLAEVGRFHYPYLPVFDPLLMDRFHVSAVLADARVPLLVVAGDRDGVVPLSFSRQVHDRYGGPKRLVVIPDTSHNDPRLAEGSELVAEITRFIADTTSGHSSADSSRTTPLADS
jgi:fermentation-respiration switch protein FrsA (DUF1100 family)